MGCEWKASTLSVLADIQTGPFGSQLHASDYVVNGIPSIMPQNIGDNIISEQGIARISALDVKRLNRYLVKTGDIVYSRRGDVEKRALIRAHQSGWLCGTGCLRVRPNMEVIDPVFLSYHLGNPLTRAWIVQHAHGATMPNLNTEILSAVPIFVPSMEVQQSIAATLSCLDDKIVLNNKINANLEAQAQAIFKSWFVDFEPFQDSEFVDSELGRIPKGWRVGCIGDVVRLQRGHDLPVNTIEHGKYPVLGSKGILGYHDEYTTQAPCIVMGRSGNIGNPRYYPFSCWAHNTTIYVKEYFCAPLWAFYILKQVDYSIFKGGSAVPTLNRNHVESYHIIIPPEVAQKNFHDLINPMIEVINHKIEENLALETLRDTLLPKLMSGEVAID